jgi:hypothetical protein
LLLVIDYSGQNVHPIRSKVYNLIWDRFAL